MSSSLQEKLQSLLDGLIAQGSERGAQVVVFQNGKEIANVSAGVADPKTGRLVETETLFPVFSTMKGVLSTGVHLLAERGKIAYDTPIAAYWPEFAANGKEAVTVRHALAHTAGIPNMPDDGIEQEQLNDWDFMCRAIAQLKPVWPPGHHQQYHAHTLSFILGELIRRVDGRSYQRFTEEEIGQPIGANTLFSGLPAAQDARVALIEPGPDFTETLPPPPRSTVPCMVPLHDWINTLPARRMCHPGVNGIANATALARHYAALLPGGIDGVELLPPNRMKLAVEPHTGSENVPDDGRGLGYQRGTHVPEMGESPTAFGHQGHGGSVAYGDSRHRLAVAVVRNRFSSSNLATAVSNEIQAVLGV